MTSNLGKSFTFLSLSCLAAFFAVDAFAQNDLPAQTPSLKSASGIVKSPPKAEIRGVTETRLKLPRREEEDDHRVKKISEDKSGIEVEELEPLRFGAERSLFRPPSAVSYEDLNVSAPTDESATAQNGKTERFRWRTAVGQSLMFLGIQHGFALATQSKTREALKGEFWNDYAASVRSMNHFDDGGRFFTNYIAHPMQGAFTGFIYVQNDPKGLKQQFGASGKYWRSRLKVMAWSAAWSTQFEIGPISQASIGNIGLKGKQTWGDIVVTPTFGTALLISEDAIDRFVMKRIERATENFYIRIFSRMLLNPTRAVANLFRFKEPWFRDRPREH